MDNAGIVVIGASAGGVQALQTLVSGLPADFAGAVLITLHVSPSSPRLLPEILRGAGPLPVRYAADGDAIEPGHIYVAPPDRHMLIEATGRLMLSRGPKENHARPAIYPLFRSAAMVFGARVVDVILTGGLNDGSSGLRAIKFCGGLAVVQDPKEAEAPSMPASAMRVVDVDFCLPLAEIASLLSRLVMEMGSKSVQVVEGIMRKALEIETGIAAEDESLRAGVVALGDPSLFTCPECHGALLELHDKKPLRYRCHTGHAFTADSLLAAVRAYAEDTIWNTIRTLQETSMLMLHMATHAQRNGDPTSADELLQSARATQQRSDQIRNVHLQPETIMAPTEL